MGTIAIALVTDQQVCPNSLIRYLQGLTGQVPGQPLCRISSPFYDPLPLPAGASKPEVAVFYNEPIPDGGQHAVSIAYMAQNQALQIRYRKDLYLFGYFSEHLQHFLNHFPSFLSESIPFRAMLDIPPAQRQQCLFDWNRTERGFQEDKSLHELIELQAARTPDSPAVIYN